MKIHAVILVGLVGMSWLFGSFCQGKEINLSLTEYRPYMSQSLPNKGLLSEIVERAFALEGVTIKYHPMSSSKAFHLIKMGEIDASIGWTATEERRSFAYFSSPIFYSKVVLFYRKDNPVNWNELPTSDLVTLGITQHYYYGLTFEMARQSRQFKVQTANSDKINFKKLIGTRIDAFPIAVDVGRDILLRKFPKRQTQHLGFSARPINIEPLSVMFSKKHASNKQLLETFERGMAKLKASGDYQKILQKFNSRLNI